MFANTVVSSKNLLEGILLQGRPIRTVLVSSFSVYGAGDLPRGGVVDENTPLESRPEKRDLYGQCKLRQEQLFWEYHRQKRLPLTVLRPGVIYGPRGSALSARNEPPVEFPAASYSCHSGISPAHTMPAAMVPAPSPAEPLHEPEVPAPETSNV